MRDDRAEQKGLTQMAEVTERLDRSMGSSDGRSWESIKCPHCPGHSMFRVAVETERQPSGPTRILDQATRCLRCPQCLGGAIAKGTAVHPSVSLLGEVEGLPQVDAEVWQEVRACLGVGAYTAAVMLCRKLLFHIAVDKGLEPSNAKGFAPGFKECVNYLETEGVITKNMLGWVDQIKDVGNDANHEVTPVTEQQAMAVGTFTQQLLTLAYALDAMRLAQGVVGSDEELPR